ncbi:hypothetical protein KAR91_53825 [Candidatus Pacearchaeota archaeon]|nr:hypothetical protein [Candidatus Pacearchaeota archaeon]
MKTVQYYFSKLGSRKFQTLVIGLVLHLIDSKAFPADNVMFLMVAYMSLNVLDKYLQGKIKSLPGGPN